MMSTASTILLTIACMLAVVMVGPFSAAASRGATLALCTILAALAVTSGNAMGIPVAVVAAAMLERLARSRAISLPTGTGYAGACVVSAAVACGALRPLSYAPLESAGTAALSPGAAAAMAASVVGVLVVQAVAGRR